MTRLSILALLALTSCHSSPDVRPFPIQIEEAHGAGAWWSQSAAMTSIEVEFGGNRMLEGRLVTEPDGAHTRIIRGNGETIVSDGVTVWVDPPEGADSMDRFHSLTWSYFLAAPFKLRDPGANLEPLEPGMMNGKSYDMARLTFGAGVGDAPDDWYLLYRDPETGRLEAMAYVVTYGKDPAELTADDEHAIVYHNFQTIDGVAVPMRWSFHNWNLELGPHGDPIGEAKLTDFRFIDPPRGTFVRPRNSVEVPAP